jgi:hypothetical protein
MPADLSRAFGGVIVVQHVVGADLPDHEVRMRRHHVALDAAQHRAHGVAADAAVEHAHLGAQALPELDGKPARIAVLGPGGAHALGRGRAQGHDRDGLARLEPRPHMRQRGREARDPARGMAAVGGGAALDPGRGEGRQHERHRPEQQMPTAVEEAWHGETHRTAWAIASARRSPRQA